MRLFLWVLVSLTAVTFAQAEDSPLVPPPLDLVLSKIKPDMKKAEVAAILSAVYPKVKAQGGIWSGDTGYVGFVLDDSYSLLVSAQFDSKKEAVVHPDLLFYLFDNPKKQRFEIRKGSVVGVYSWAKKEANHQPEPMLAKGPHGSS